MAIVKILAREGRLDEGVSYAVNGDKTENRVLTARPNCASGRACRRMPDTEFARERLPGYETLIGVHVDEGHIRARLVFNSANAETGEKYRGNAGVIAAAPKENGTARGGTSERPSGEARLKGDRTQLKKPSAPVKVKSRTKSRAKAR